MLIRYQKKTKETLLRLKNDNKYSIMCFNSNNEYLNVMNNIMNGLKYNSMH